MVKIEITKTELVWPGKYNTQTTRPVGFFKCSLANELSRGTLLLTMKTWELSLKTMAGNNNDANPLRRVCRRVC